MERPAESGTVRFADVLAPEGYGAIMAHSQRMGVVRCAVERIKENDSRKKRSSGMDLPSLAGYHCWLADGH